MAFVVIFGIGFGAITPARAALIADFYGRANYGSISSVMALFATGARALRPIAVGVAFDTIGSYLPAFWTLAGISAIAAGAIVIAENKRPAPQTINQGLELEKV